MAGSDDEKGGITLYDKIMKKISEAMLGVSVISLSIAIVLNAVEIFRRFLYDGSFYWIQDVTLLCMMWFIFPGMVIISYKGNDVFVDIFLHKFPKKMQTTVNIINDMLVMAICAILFRYSINLMLLRMGKSMLASEIPYFWYTLAMVIVFFLLTLVYLGKVIIAFACKKGKEGTDV